MILPNIRSIAFLLLLVSVAACGVRQNNVKLPNFDVSGYVSHLVAFDSANRLQLKAMKTIQIDGKTETVNSDTFDLKQELMLFSEVDITKPFFKGMYQLDSVEKDGKQITTYTSDSKFTKVKSLSVTRAGQSTTIVIDYLEQNQLYTNARQMHLQTNGDTVKFYSVKGFHKLITQDTLFYHISAETH